MLDTLPTIQVSIHCVQLDCMYSNSVYHVGRLRPVCVIISKSVQAVSVSCFQFSIVAKSV